MPQTEMPMYYYVISIILGLFTLVCMWFIFRKAGRPGWASLIPIYNTVVLCQIAGYSGWYVLLLLIPIIDIIFSFLIYLGLAARFGRGTLFGIGLFFLSPIFLAIMAFNKNIQYEYAVAPSTSTTTPSFSPREYYEKKAAAPAQASTSAEVKPSPGAVPRAFTSAPLPPPPTLSQKVDEMAAQDCFTLANEMETKGEKEKAIEHYTKAIRLNSRHTAAYFKRGILLMELNCKPAAIADFRRVVEFADHPELADIAKGHLTSLGK
ncbi:MAG: DUF5684 domain-containing protein [Dehalococcoidia bacterium]